MELKHYLVLLAIFSLVAWTADSSSTSNFKNETSDRAQNQFDQGIIEIEDRITIVEPYKSLLSTTAKFALAQTRVTKFVQLDTAVRITGDLLSVILRPKVLVKLVRVLASAFAVLFTTTFFFPGTYHFMESVWTNPVDALNLDRMATSADETLNGFGLRDDRCREQTICQLGEILRCSFPKTSEALIKFASDNFSSSGITEHAYPKAFNQGFVERNCARLGYDNRDDSSSCLSNFFNSILASSRSHLKDKRSSY